MAADEPSLSSGGDSSGLISTGGVPANPPNELRQRRRAAKLEQPQEERSGEEPGGGAAAAVQEVRGCLAESY